MRKFFKMVKYELVRVARNKIIMAMLLLFCVGFLLILSFMNVEGTSFPMALYTGGMNIEDVAVIDVIEAGLGFDNVRIVESKEEGLNLIKRGDVCFFIYLEEGEDSENVNAAFYYDQTSVVGRSVKSAISESKNKYAYTTIANFLQEYGISIDESYFDLVDFLPASEKNISAKQMTFGMQVAVCVAIVLMLGMAYSMARDHESNVGKNLSYMPVGVNRYLMSKVLPYFLLGLTQMVLLYVLGEMMFKIDFEINFFVVLLLSLLFVLATISLSMIFSLFKSQIATVFLDMLAVILPVFILVIMYVQSAPIYVQIPLNFMPIIPFVNLLNGMIFNGVIIWENILILIVQLIGYYLIAMFILKSKTSVSVKNPKQENRKFQNL